MAGLELGAALLRQYADLLVAAFAPTALPTWLPRLIAVVVIAALAVLIVGNAVRRARRRPAIARRTGRGRCWARRSIAAAPHAHFGAGCGIC